MIKVKALMNFTLARFNEITNLKRIGNEEPGKLFTGDTFECSKDLADYLAGGNGKGVIAVEIIEIIPDTYEDVKLVDTDKVEVYEIKETKKPRKNKKKKEFEN